MTPRAVACVGRDGAFLAGRLLAAIDPVHGGFGRERVDAAAHQLLWHHYMVTGEPAYCDAVIASLRAICRALPVEAQTLGGNAQLLELLSWVWRQHRCPALRQCAERIVTWAVARLRRPDICFDHAGLMLVALVEAGSVFERRDCLAVTRKVFDAIAGHLGSTGRLDDYAMMGRAAVRLFEAFGKPRYLDQAEAWVARPDDAPWDSDHRGGPGQEVGPPTGGASILDATLPSGIALLIGVLARLHALTGKPCYAARALRFVGPLRDVITHWGIDAATASANLQTLARLVSIRISGDPTLEETREMMRVALDCGLPDRMVLGPGAGGPADASPTAAISLGTRHLAPIVDVTQLRLLIAPGGLSGMP